MPSEDIQDFTAYPVHHIDFPFPDQCLQPETDCAHTPKAVTLPNACYHHESTKALLSDASHLIKDTVICGPVATNAVVHTRAAISVFFPSTFAANWLLPCSAFSVVLDLTSPDIQFSAVSLFTS
ncbi:hypothetical protein DAPPUDRAFT_115258 [Daphnia pulex]|uniref:Uncharacterized protein n=1 Tax=Daphnia pulex TaxID=6669 RepID=E9HKS7_DAPPU|nr:hypothetical protein DAPPUDRAFT_115258 [Daphnia pulex]|eukprot:EFX67665.1 hypothetical protein DAPPUDRAFT_115258 [Daphnia pulex]